MKVAEGEGLADTETEGEPLPVGVREGVREAVGVRDGTTTCGSDRLIRAARSTGFTPVVAEYALKKPDVDSESSSGEEPPSVSEACASDKELTTPEAESC